MPAIRRIVHGSREFVLVGTAHVSAESVREVVDSIETEKPDRVCVELDPGRHGSLTKGSDWRALDIAKVLKQGKGFLLLANLALSSFQRRMGSGSGTKPGAEMLAAVETAEKAGVPWSLCDREVQVTLRRAWTMSGLWGKAKLVASLLSGVAGGDEVSPAEIEKLKEQNELDAMMAELADYLPSVKKVLIDERDRYLAAKIWASDGARVLAVIGAGHAAGVEDWLGRFARDEAATDVAEIDSVPGPGFFSKILPYALPAILVALFGASFLRSGALASLRMLGFWVLLNGGLAALGSALCLAHPLTILVSFVSAPVATLNPLVGVGLFAGLTEAYVRKPSVADFESLQDDIASFRGFYRNRVTHILLVFFVSTLLAAIGNFFAIPLLAGTL